MGNSQHKTTGESIPKRRRRPNSIAVDRFDKFPAGSSGDAVPELRRTASQHSFRRRYNESGKYSYKTPWPAPMSEVVFWPEYESKPPVNFIDFEILATIGKGAFGHVLEVKHKQTGQLFAMKVLNKAEIIKENAVQQCKDEVTIQMKLNSFPFLVKTFYTWQTKHNLFIVSDFVDGSDLFTLWLQENELAEDNVKLYVAELALTLDFLNKNGVIYRDLKLENVLLDQNGHAKIIDFGLSKLVTHGERRSTICGTLQYMAPEVLRGESYTAACDWWSLGIVMYALIVGKYPYASQVDHTAQQKVVEGSKFDFPSHVSSSAQDLLSQLLQKDPKKRLSSLESLKNHPFFEGFSFDDVMTKTNQPLSEKTLKKLRRRSTASRTFFPRTVEPRKSRQPRPLSWASPGNFIIHDRIEMDFLIADLGSLNTLNTGKASSTNATDLHSVGMCQAEVPSGKLCTAPS